MPMIFVETLEDFIAEHGQAVEDGGRLLFPDGARCDLRGSLRWEPPSDPTALLKAQHLYWMVRVEQSESSFVNTKAAFMEQASWHEMNPDSCPPPPPDAAKILRGLKAAVTAARGKLREVEQQLSGTTDGKRRRQQQENQRARQTAARSQASEIRNIEI